jgi:flagellar protein FlbD
MTPQHRWMHSYDKAGLMMIRLKRLNDTEIVVNADQIKYVESTPDTIITLMNNEKILVANSPDEIIQKVLEYKRMSYPVASTEQSVVR